MYALPLVLVFMTLLVLYPFLLWAQYQLATFFVSFYFFQVIAGSSCCLNTLPPGSSDGLHHWELFNCMARLIGSCICYL